MEPVELYNPNTDRTYTARTPVDLNDRLGEGYRRAEQSASPAPRKKSDDADKSEKSDESVFSRWITPGE